MRRTTSASASSCGGREENHFRLKAAGGALHFVEGEIGPEVRDVPAPPSQSDDEGQQSDFVLLPGQAGGQCPAGTPRLGGGEVERYQLTYEQSAGEMLDGDRDAAGHPLLAEPHQHRFDDLCQDGLDRMKRQRLPQCAGGLGLIEPQDCMGQAIAETVQFE
jgi:hypothetical protein